ncbi:hypothetical protein [Nonomuraea sp. NPDC049646]|uniref:hypothetical protein n=1 Tax=unclassified Nonomuraea TaxID=2593643 RepID=UPI0037B7253C
MAVAEATSRVRLILHGMPPMQTAERRKKQIVMLPVRLDISYTYEPRTGAWRTSWVAIGRRRLIRSGAFSTRAEASLTNWHVDDVPGWITEAIHRHHPRPAALRRASA